jgi:phospho-N-acetylmuramoyl-pentapeptide-transferase
MLIFAAAVAFMVTALLGFGIIPWLRKLKIGQTILDIGPKWHKSKEGIPTMGGLLFVAGTAAAFAIFILPKLIVDIGDPSSKKLIAGFVMALSFGFVGFLDDYIKVVKKRNQGLDIKQKTLLQIVIILGYLFTVWKFEGGAPHMWAPFFGDVAMPWWAFFPFGFGVLYAAVNAVNFTDGVDGLCSSVTATASAAFIALAYLVGQQSTAVMAAALLGACLGFLCWNHKPAKVIMGDVGALFLGGMVVALAYTLNAPLILLLFGIIYVIEGLSDVIQIGYFKVTHGKRVFKMAPIHHHFELSGWSEKKIVFIFCAVNVAGIALGYVLLKTGGYLA